MKMEKQSEQNLRVRAPPSELSGEGCPERDARSSSRSDPCMTSELDAPMMKRLAVPLERLS